MKIEIRENDYIKLSNDERDQLFDLSRDHNVNIRDRDNKLVSIIDLREIDFDDFATALKVKFSRYAEIERRRDDETRLELTDSYLDEIKRLESELINNLKSLKSLETVDYTLPLLTQYLNSKSSQNRMTILSLIADKNDEITKSIDDQVLRLSDETREIEIE